MVFSGLFAQPSDSRPVIESRLREELGRRLTALGSKVSDFWVAF